MPIFYVKNFYEEVLIRPFEAFQEAIYNYPEHKFRILCESLEDPVQFVASHEKFKREIPNVMTQEVLDRITEAARGRRGLLGEYQTIIESFDDRLISVLGGISSDTIARMRGVFRQFYKAREEASLFPICAQGKMTPERFIELEITDEEFEKMMEPQGDLRPFIPIPDEMKIIHYCRNDQQLTNRLVKKHMISFIKEHPTPLRWADIHIGTSSSQLNRIFYVQEVYQNAILRFNNVTEIDV